MGNIMKLNYHNAIQTHAFQSKTGRIYFIRAIDQEAAERTACIIHGPVFYMGCVPTYEAAERIGIARYYDAWAERNEVSIEGMDEAAARQRDSKRIVNAELAALFAAA